MSAPATYSLAYGSTRVEFALPAGRAMGMIPVSSADDVARGRGSEVEGYVLPEGAGCRPVAAA